MNKLGQRIFMIMAVLSCVAIAAAQGGGGGQGRRGGQRGGRGGFVSELSLTMRADVQKELAITDDEKTKLTDLSQKSRPQRGAGGGGGAGVQTDPAERQKQAAERRVQQHKDLAGILTDSQMKRLGELYIQRRGMQALGDSEVQEALKLSTDQVQKIKDLMQKDQEASRA